MGIGSRGQGNVLATLCMWMGSEGDRGILPATLCMWKGIEGDREMCMLHYACHLMHEEGKGSGQGQLPTTWCIMRRGRVCDRIICLSHNA